MDASIEIAKYLIGRLPPIMLAVLLGMVIPITVGVWAHFSKKISWKIVKVNGETVPQTSGNGERVKPGTRFISKDDLRENCERRQGSLDRKLESMNSGIMDVARRVDKLLDTMTEYRIELGERLARCEEANK